MVVSINSVSNTGYTTASIQKTSYLARTMSLIPVSQEQTLCHCSRPPSHVTTHIVYYPLFVVVNTPQYLSIPQTAISIRESFPSQLVQLFSFSSSITFTLIFTFTRLHQPTHTPTQPSDLLISTFFSSSHPSCLWSIKTSAQHPAYTF
jgi:hypothetical protein